MSNTTNKRRAASASATRCVEISPPPNFSPIAAASAMGTNWDQQAAELGQPHALWEMRQQFTGDREREPCLADAPRPGQGDEPAGTDKLRDFLDLGGAADQR